MHKKIALFGFGSFPVVYRHLIEIARAERSPVEFCMILTTPNWRNVMREVLPPEEILDVFAELPRAPVGGDLSLLSNYKGSLVEDLAAFKRAYRKRSGEWLRARAVDYYRMFTDFLINRRATHLLLSNIESPEAKIVVAAAQELGIGVIAPMDLRSLSGTYFSIDSYETPPAYGDTTPEAHKRAIDFIQAFRRQALPARRLPSDLAVAHDDQTILQHYLPHLKTRARRFIAAALERPDLFDYEEIRVSLMRNFNLIRKTIRGLRCRRNEQQYDIAHQDMLPRRFIYYPLQYTPEASINVPAPYFVDQLRAIDALRFTMPNDCTLVVKEHPACLDMRPVSFLARLRRLPGIKVARVTIPSIDLIQRAALTATITGTAVLEAFFLGRPAIALGRGLPAWVLGECASLQNLRDDIAAKLDRPIPDEFVTAQIAKLMNVRYPFFFATAHMPNEPMLRVGNLKRFWAALQDHLGREQHT